MKIRVLEVLPTLRRAGAENIAVTLACDLPTDHFEAGVVSLFGPFPQGLEPVLGARGVHVWHLEKRRGFDPRMWPRLARVFREFGPDVLHTHSYVLRYVLPVAGGARVVHSLHNLSGKDPDRLTGLLNRFAYRRGVLPVAVSATVASSFQEAYGRSPEATISNGIDLTRFAGPDARGKWRSAHGFTADDILIASVARLEPQKDPATLLKAFASGCSARNRCHLIVAGDGSLRTSAEALSRRLGMEERVRFLGQQGDVSELLRAADVFALSSRWEGNPVSVMEAMTAGLPVVATRAGGIPELVEDGVTGFLAPPEDPVALGKSLALLVTDPALRQAIGEAARVRAADFSSARMVNAYANLFAQVAGRTP